MNFDKLKELKQWVLCFAKVGEKIPVIVTKQTAKPNSPSGFAAFRIF